MTIGISPPDKLESISMWNACQTVIGLQHPNEDRETVCIFIGLAGKKKSFRDPLKALHQVRSIKVEAEPLPLVRSLGKEPRKCDQQLKPCDTTRHVVTRLGCQDDFARLQEMFGWTNATQLHFSDSQGQNAIGCTWTVSIGWNTPWKFNISSLKIGHPKRKGSSSKQHFSGASCWTSVAEVGRCMSGARGWLESLLANMRTRWEMESHVSQGPPFPVGLG